MIYKGPEIGPLLLSISFRCPVTVSFWWGGLWTPHTGLFLQELTTSRRLDRSSRDGKDGKLFSVVPRQLIEQDHIEHRLVYLDATVAVVVNEAE